MSANPWHALPTSHLKGLILELVLAMASTLTTVVETDFLTKGNWLNHPVLPWPGEHLAVGRFEQLQMPFMSAI
jgi:hypothetical protein